MNNNLATDLATPLHAANAAESEVEAKLGVIGAAEQQPAGLLARISAG